MSPSGRAQRQLPVAAICSHSHVSRARAPFSSPFDKTRTAEITYNEGEEWLSRSQHAREAVLAGSWWRGETSHPRRGSFPLCGQEGAVSWEMSHSTANGIIQRGHGHSCAQSSLACVSGSPRKREGLDTVNILCLQRISLSPTNFCSAPDRQRHSAV